MSTCIELCVDVLTMNSMDSMAAAYIYKKKVFFVCLFVMDTQPKFVCLDLPSYLVHVLLPNWKEQKSSPSNYGMVKISEQNIVLFTSSFSKCAAFF